LFIGPSFSCDEGYDAMAATRWTQGEHLFKWVDQDLLSIPALVSYFDFRSSSPWQVRCHVKTTHYNFA
jgi:hypothetical protein